MSDDNDNETMMCCASCGIAEIDDIKLTQCDSCDLVRYCSLDCQREHKAQHEEACKKRAAELRDKLLFKQPESTHLGDCPICCLPMAMELDQTRSISTSCCYQLICISCVIANAMREKEASMVLSCPFCREPNLLNDGEFEKRKMIRIKANDPVAFHVEGSEQYDEGNYGRAFEWYTKAAQLGNADAHSKLAAMYHLGKGVEEDEGKMFHHLGEAAIGGHPKARHLLGKKELENGNIDRAVKHWIIAAKQGEEKSIKLLMLAFKDGFISKDLLAATLRAHQAAVDATKSPQRETAPRFK